MDLISSAYLSSRLETTKTGFRSIYQFFHRCNCLMNMLQFWIIISSNAYIETSRLSNFYIENHTFLGYIRNHYWCFNCSSKNPGIVGTYLHTTLDSYTHAKWTHFGAWKRILNNKQPTHMFHNTNTQSNNIVQSRYDCHYKFLAHLEYWSHQDVKCFNIE